MPFSSMWIKDSLRGKINLHKQDILKINPAFQKFVSNKSFFFIWTSEKTSKTYQFDTMKHDLKINQKVNIYIIYTEFFFTFKRAVLIMSISQWEENLLLKLKRKKQICIFKKKPMFWLKIIVSKILRYVDQMRVIFYHPASITKENWGKCIYLTWTVLFKTITKNSSRYCCHQ